MILQWDRDYDVKIDPEICRNIRLFVGGRYEPYVKAFNISAGWYLRYQTKIRDNGTVVPVFVDGGFVFEHIRAGFEIRDHLGGVVAWTHGES